MKILICMAVFLATTFFSYSQNSWIRINQIGYLPDDVKVAVLVSKEADINVTVFEVCDALTEQTVIKSTNIQSYGRWGAFEKSHRLDFTSLHTEGSYFIKIGSIKSPAFRIADDVYAGTADFLLRYMRQQRCGFNPVLNDSCHTAGGYILYGDSLSSHYQTFMPYSIFGGWHDASDYLQYVPTTATAVFQMLFAYEQNPSVFGDFYNARGLKGKNGIPDILDEVKWGMDWLIKMNPEPNIMFNQVCDDRDHRGMRMPHKDTFTYDINGSQARPVYRITGKPQGLFKYQNRTEGVASSAAKFCSAFAAGARVFKDFDIEYSKNLKQKAFDAYQFALTDLGKCQTAPCRAPYFYEEDNWADDMALAATQLNLFNVLYQRNDEMKAKRYLAAEPYSLWMGQDTARHYQFYPFINYGPYFLATSKGSSQKKDKNILKKHYGHDLERLRKRAKSNPFNIGTLSIWCSNNYISAAATEALLYEKILLDTTFSALKTAHRDWLFGCNPWGTSMIIGLPDAEKKSVFTSDGILQAATYPRDPHSAFTHYGKIQIDGGLVDGALRNSIFSNLIGLTLYQPDEFGSFQSKEWVYHDDYGDYSTNEPTMDGTASLIYFLSAQEQHGRTLAKHKNVDQFGAIDRMDTTLKTIHLVFTGHDFAEGGEEILRGLEKNKVKASFFLTGDFLRKYEGLSQKIAKNGHYVGAHSDKHLLYADWTKRDSTLITPKTFIDDLKKNYQALQQIGIAKNQALFFMPPFEWYNDSIAIWTKQAGLKLINFTSGTGSNADYTTPDMSNYKTSSVIYNNILSYEKNKSTGLNGFILLFHVGAGDKRVDKMSERLDDLLKKLRSKGYRFERF